jgi:anti-sigma B factor antagonist
LDYSFFLHDQVLFISIKGDLLGLESEWSLVKLIEDYSIFNINQCVLDISGLMHVNSKGLNVLIKMLTNLDERQGDMIVMNPTSQVQKLFSITKLDMVFKMANSRFEALCLLKEAKND